MKDLSPIRKAVKRVKFRHTVFGELLMLVGVALIVAFLASLLRNRLAGDRAAAHLVALSVERLSEDDEPVVTALLKRSSGGDATDIRFSLEVDGQSIPFSPTKKAAVSRTTTTARGGRRESYSCSGVRVSCRVQNKMSWLLLSWQ